ncbi:hypothetical protein, partial [Streptococcus iniae]|uniref:hypothetical protein n=2 Tax=Streptococcus iniae TaxID=1346 RepID=UPI003AB99C17
IKLAKNLDPKTSNTQKPHSNFVILNIFKTEITVWFYLKLLFAQPLLYLQVYQANKLRRKTNDLALINS